MIEEEDLVQIITIDFETYYDKKYSLSKLTTEEYINDTRFQVIGVGVKVNANKAEWFSGTHDEIYNLIGSTVVLQHITLCLMPRYCLGILIYDPQGGQILFL